MVGFRKLGFMDKQNWNWNEIGMTKQVKKMDFSIRVKQTAGAQFWCGCFTALYSILQVYDNYTLYI